MNWFPEEIVDFKFLTFYENVRNRLHLNLKRTKLVYKFINIYFILGYSSMNELFVK